MIARLTLGQKINYTLIMISLSPILFLICSDNDVVGRQSGVIPSQGQLQDSVVNQSSDGTHFSKHIPARGLLTFTSSP